MCCTNTAQKMVNRDETEIHDPFLMAGMKEAVTRIRSALENNERIAIYGDYDVDGMTSSALLASWLKSKGVDYEIYIPNRIDEGYGLNTTALDTLKSHGVDLVITVDCGVTALKEAEYAKEIGLGLVITDHHECIAKLPEADAIIDPKRHDCNYPNKELAGVGVVFKLICALENDIDPTELLKKYGGLVAIGTIADVVSVIGENREFIRCGLDVLNNEPGIGLYELFRTVENGIGKITGTTIGFFIAPRLNAAGRMGNSELSVNLLLSEDESEAAMYAAELSELNLERRRLEALIFEEISTMLPKPGFKQPIILSHRGWHQGVTGIVAAKIAERYCLPTIIICVDDSGIGRGSCRSFGNFNIFEALMTCEDILANFGGHEMAAGVTIAEENIDELRRRINEYFFSNKKCTAKHSLRLDFEVEKPQLLTKENIEALESLEPFGNGNLPPSLCIKKAELLNIHSIGLGKHSKLTLKKLGQNLDCICFSMPKETLGVTEGMNCDVAFEPQINVYKGKSTVQLQVIDIKPSSVQE
jgi:single-stranded-DNA-specific exonuclease